MSVRITRGLPRWYSGYDHTKPLPETRKSKPSQSISSTCGNASARRRTSLSSAITVPSRTGEVDGSSLGCATDSPASPGSGRQHHSPGAVAANCDDLGNRCYRQWSVDVRKLLVAWAHGLVCDRGSDAITVDDQHDEIVDIRIQKFGNCAQLVWQ